MKTTPQTRRITRIRVHNMEERIKHALRDQIAEAASLLEVVLSCLVLIGLLLPAKKFDSTFDWIDVPYVWDPIPCGLSAGSFAGQFGPAQ